MPERSFPQGSARKHVDAHGCTTWGRRFHKTAAFIRAKGGVGLTAYSIQHDVEDHVPVETPLTEAWEAKWI